MSIIIAFLPRPYNKKILQQKTDLGNEYKTKTKKYACIIYFTRTVKHDILIVYYKILSLPSK